MAKCLEKDRVDERWVGVLAGVGHRQDGALAYCSPDIFTHYSVRGMRDPGDRAGRKELKGPVQRTVVAIASLVPVFKTLEFQPKSMVAQFQPLEFPLGSSQFMVAHSNFPQPFRGPESLVMTPATTWLVEIRLPSNRVVNLR